MMPTIPAHGAIVPPSSMSGDDRRRFPFHLPAVLAPRTLRGRLALAHAALIVAVLMALGVYLVIAGRQLYIDRLADQLAAQAQMAGAAVSPALAAGEGAETIDPLVKRLGAGLDARVTIVASGGRVLGDSLADPGAMDNHGGRPEIVAARAAGLGQAQRRSATLDAGFLYVAVPIPNAPGAVARVALPLDEVDSTVSRIRRDVGIATASAATLAIIVALVIAGRITGPLEELRQRARTIAAGQFDAVVRPAGTRELGDLGRAFNAMAADLRQLVAKQEQTRTRLEATLANLHDGVVITDGAGAVVQMNGAAARMLGTTSDVAVGQPFVVASRDHDLAGLLRVALTADEPRSATIELGGRRTVESAAQPISGGGERLGLIVLSDVTELRRLERMRREFVANVSHELRTPLTSIRAVVETLEAGAAHDPDAAGQFFGNIIGEVDHLAALVDELLDLARLESGRAALRLAAFDPAGVLASAVDRLRPQVERAGLTVRVEAPPALPQVRGDGGRIEQVLINLLHNAVKFTPTGGEIVVAANVAGAVLRVSVQDTGVGIAAEELPRIFERFYKTDPARRSPGSGLGLAIAKHVVQAHGGSIWAESAPGRGATLLFTLPLAVPQDEPPVGQI